PLPPLRPAVSKTGQAAADPLPAAAAPHSGDPPPVPPAPAAPAGPSPHVRPAEPAAAAVLPQLVEATVVAKPGVTELRLSPEELGAVRIDLRAEGDRVTLAISAERQDTLDLMRRHADRLAGDLRAAGFSQLDLSFGRWSGEGQKGQPTPPPLASPMPGHGDPALLASPSPLLRPLPPLPGGLYLRI
ncbi:flagellar hook-length control protein FliK, partial [Xinfangfangia pollutisoli]|uniref:flagellar hook-length control protein FliK n=1 Tax=Xinfangfangia pollutisoli TaxID=2865960 RepID=UPI001CD220C5